MAAGTIRNAVNQMLAAGSWENKKKSGNLLKKKDAELTPQERMIQDLRNSLRPTVKVRSIIKFTQSS